MFSQIRRQLFVQITGLDGTIIEKVENPARTRRETVWSRLEGIEMRAPARLRTCRSYGAMSLALPRDRDRVHLQHEEAPIVTTVAPGNFFFFLFFFAVLVILCRRNTWESRGCAIKGRCLSIFTHLCVMVYLCVCVCVCACMCTPHTHGRLMHVCSPE